MSSDQLTKELLSQQIQKVLDASIRILFPLNVDPKELIKPHVWRDEKYVGRSIDGRVASWRGWSANLVRVDFRYRTVFVDVVDNTLPETERVRLFGADFASAVERMRQFVVIFVLDFPFDAVRTIKEQGFIPRKLARVVHACVIADTHEFLAQAPLFWAAQLTRLVMLQRLSSIHRKPLESSEVPFQNLLYKTGYLHSYVVNGGLELQKLSRPRKAGNFGHDFHAIVRNPDMGPHEPFPVGIEVYTGAIGYHTGTIPKYIHRYNLRGMIIIAKDDPLPALLKVSDSLQLPIITAEKLSLMGANTSIAIHYLPLNKIIRELMIVRDELESIIPTTRRYLQ